MTPVLISLVFMFSSIVCCANETDIQQAVVSQTEKLGFQGGGPTVGDIEGDCIEGLSSTNSDNLFDRYVSEIENIRTQEYKKPCIDSKILNEVDTYYNLKYTNGRIDEVASELMDKLNDHLFSKKGVIKVRYCNRTFMNLRNEEVCLEKEFFNAVQEHFPDDFESIYRFFIAHELSHHLQFMQCCKNKGTLLMGEKCNYQGLEDHYEEIHKETDTYTVLLLNQLGQDINYKSVVKFLDIFEELKYGRAENILEAAKEYESLRPVK